MPRNRAVSGALWQPVCLEPLVRSRTSREGLTSLWRASELLSVHVSLECQRFEKHAHFVCKACYQPIGSILLPAASRKAFQLYKRIDSCRAPQSALAQDSKMGPDTPHEKHMYGMMMSRAIERNVMLRSLLMYCSGS